jgi:hypothetical protein
VIANGAFYEVFARGQANAKGGFARAPRAFELRLEPDKELLTEWVAPMFQLKWDSGPFDDYLANSAVIPLCSEKMRDVIDRLRGETDLLEWLPVEVQDVTISPHFAIQDALPGMGEEQPVEMKGSGETKVHSSSRYYILHLLEELDVLDWSRTTTVGPDPGYAVRLYLDLDKVGKHQIFRYKGRGDITVCVANNIRRALLERNCTGCSFSRIPTS